jgi:hypothetical protein
MKSQSLNSLIPKQQELMSKLDSIVDNDRSTINDTLRSVVDCTRNSVEMIDTLIDLIESDTRQGIQSQDLEGGEFEKYVNIVDAYGIFQKALEIGRVWSDLSYTDKEMLLINCINNARLKRIYDSISYEYAEKGKPIPNGTIDLIEWFVGILNLGLTEARKMKLYFPDMNLADKFYRPGVMIRATENLNHKIKEVILPAVLDSTHGAKVICAAIVVT